MMRTLCLLLACLACVGISRRKSISHKKKGACNPANLLIKFLVAAHPTATFHPSCPGGQSCHSWPQHSQTGVADSRTRFKRRLEGSVNMTAATSTSAKTADVMDHVVGSEWEKVGVDSKCLIEAMRENLDIIGPNELQIKSTPAILEGADVILSSFTGSGKTLAGLVPLLNQMLKEKAHKPEAVSEGESDMLSTPQLVVITPTRELSLQTLRVLEGLMTSCTDLLRAITEEEYLAENQLNTINLLYKERLPDIVVGTPKELLLMIDRKAMDFSQVKFMMLDEVDMLVDTDNYRLSRLIDWLPGNPVQFILASASALAHPEMKKLTAALLPEGYQMFDLGDKQEGTLSVPPTLKHAILEIRDDEGQWTSNKSRPEEAWPYKFEALQKILATRERKQSILVFVNKYASASHGLLKKLRGQGVRAELMTTLRKVRLRNVETHERMETVGAVVIATDEVAARGLDYGSVNMVINFDLPFGVKNYLHRAGRSGRAGRQGTVISMVSNPKELRFLNEKLLDRLGVEDKHKAEIQAIISQGDAEKDETQARKGIGKGKGKGKGKVKGNHLLKLSPLSEP